MALATPHVSRARATAASLRLSILMFLADPQWLIPSMIAPVIFGLVAFELFVGTSPYWLTYAILGAGMMSMWGQTLYGSGWATGQDREFGTLEPTLQSPTPYLYVILGRVLWNVVSGLIGGGIVYAVVVLAAGSPPPVPDPALFAVLFVFVMLTLASVGVIFAAFYVYTRYAGFIQNVGEFAFYIGTGCMFPVVLLPFWTNPIALIFPPTWALDALRYEGIPGYTGFGWGFEVDLIGAVATTAVYLVVAGAIFRRVERHVLEVGNLADY
ncbi:MAG TPA: ABC transporter permease [Thermoplasmata archaeon]|jgi:ABC-2 type transport system permease protein|nr:ABC transporter permease [Thermoplasmata archaeon]HTW77393.1 ABC transporter permease [Thermoplasmata archaeon]